MTVGRDEVFASSLILVKPVDRELIPNDAKILRLKVKVCILQRNSGKIGFVQLSLLFNHRKRDKVHI